MIIISIDLYILFPGSPLTKQYCEQLDIFLFVSP
jgi:hypothetical protein